MNGRSAVMETAKLSDVDEIIRTVRLLAGPGQVLEVRGIKAHEPGKNYRFTASGYFDNLDILAHEAAKLSGLAESIYITMNPATPSLLARAENRIKQCRDDDPTTSDKDITSRQGLLIDLDYDRPKGISTNEAEHEAALVRAGEVRDWLTSRGWPEPLEADSGNGGHLRYRIDLPNDDAARDLVQRCLEALAWRFNDRVKVDTSVFNAGRVVKLYGTLACKGDSTADRPHRLARLLHVPPRIEVVDRAMLEALAAELPKVQEPTRAVYNGKGQPFDVDRFIQQNGLMVLREGSWKDGRRWVLKECPFNPDHRDKSAYIVQHGNGAIGAGCHHDTCQGWGWRELRERYNPEAYVSERSSQSADGKVQATPASTTDEQDAEEQPKEQRKSVATRLVESALAGGIELWHTPEGDPYASMTVAGHSENWSLTNKAFREWMSGQFYRNTGSIANSQALQDALDVMKAKARYEGKEHKVHVRLARHDGDIYLDLANEAWQAVKITAQGWQVVDSSPVKFRRSKGMLPLPLPQRGGRIDELWQFVNVPGANDRVLLAAFLVSVLKPEGPYPLLVLSAEQGSAKSSTARAIRAIADPNSTPLRREPKEVRDLMIAARNSWLPAFDNLSYIPKELSDALCVLATGGGFATRQLHTDDEEMLFDVQRPVILTSIEDIATRGDLLDRAIILHLPPIPDNERKPESEMWPQFEQARPRILGALLDVVSTAMRRRPGIKLAGYPRMADFALWATAAESGLGIPTGRFMEVYQRNIKDTNSLALEADAVAEKVLQLMENTDEWEGSATQLMHELDRLFPDNERKPDGWPKRADKLSGKLTRLAPNLRGMGIDVRPRKTNGQKLIYIRKVAGTSDPSDPSDPSVPEDSLNRVATDAGRVATDQVRVASLPDRVASLGTSAARVANFPHISDESYVSGERFDPDAQKNALKQRYIERNKADLCPTCRGEHGYCGYPDGPCAYGYLSQPEPEVVKAS